MAKTNKPVDTEVKTEKPAPKPVEEKPVVKAEPAPITAIVSTGGASLTFRREDSFPSATIENGTAITVTKKNAKKMVINGENKTMAAVTLNGQKGYVVQDFLKF